MASHLRMVLPLAVVAFFASAPIAHAATTLSPALSAYAEGLDAMMAASWQESIQAFSRALDTSGDDPSFVLARGVAYALAEDFPHALQDLSRAKRLGFRGREPELWTYVKLETIIPRRCGSMPGSVRCGPITCRPKR
jgi:hypothetical protein